MATLDNDAVPVRAPGEYSSAAAMVERPSWMEFDLGALERNYETLRARIGTGPRIIAALKGNGYGHGAVAVARCLARLDVHALAVGSVEDASAIRLAGVDTPILAFGGFLPEAIPRLLHHGMMPTVYDSPGAEAVSQAATGPTRVYVKVDTGLGRLGVPLPDALEFIRKLRTMRNIVVEGVYTHLSFYDEAGREWSRARLRHSTHCSTRWTRRASGFRSPRRSQARQSWRDWKAVPMRCAPGIYSMAWRRLRPPSLALPRSSRC